MLLAVAWLAAFGMARPTMAGAVHDRPPCVRPHAQVVTADRDSVVVRRAGRTYGCLRARGRLVALGDAPGGLTSRRLTVRPRLAGRFVAFGLQVARDDVDNTIEVIDLRTGQHVVLVPAYERSGIAPANGNGTGGVTDLELRPDGSVAWVAIDPTVSPAVTVVFLCRRGSDPRLLDHAAGIDPRSLASSGRHLYWTRDGAPQEATW